MTNLTNTGWLLRRMTWKGVGFLLCCGIVPVYITSVCVSIRHYGDWCAIQVGHGIIGVFWGGDPQMRKGHIYNSGEWPVKPDTHFAGGDPGDLEWEVYGPDVTLWRVRRGEITNALGLRWPELNHRDEQWSIIVPLMYFALVGALTIAYGIFRKLRRERRGFDVIQLPGKSSG